MRKPIALFWLSMSQTIITWSISGFPTCGLTGKSFRDSVYDPRLSSRNHSVIHAGVFTNRDVYLTWETYTMKQFNPFHDVSCQYGAPMGRRNDNPANLQGFPTYKLRARRQGGGNGYDKGGAYWGSPSNVWGVWAWLDGEPVCCYVRAKSRSDAIAKIQSGE